MKTLIEKASRRPKTLAIFAMGGLMTAGEGQLGFELE